eukprot:243347-Prorocentrum_minimum.AAC.3
MFLLLTETCCGGTYPQTFEHTSEVNPSRTEVACALGAQAEEQSELEKIHDVLNEKKLSNCYKTGCTTKECPEGFKVRIVDLELSGPVVCVWCMEKDPSGTRRRHVSAAPGGDGTDAIGKYDFELTFVIGISRYRHMDQWAF